MSSRTEPLLVGKVIGDVIDMFAPSGLEMALSYATRQVSNGCDIKPSATCHPPSLRIFDPHSRDSLFTLIMVDPDAPSPSEPTMREWVHWEGTAYLANCGDMPPVPLPPPQRLARFAVSLLQKLMILNTIRIVIDIPGCSDASKGREVVPYMGPKPTVGIHRYVFAMYRQQGPLVVHTPAVRNNFCLRLFAAEHGLGLPEAALYFNAQKEPVSRAKR